MQIQDRNNNAAQQGENAISGNHQNARVSARASARDYGRDLSNYFSDGTVELMNCKVQGKH
jgi:hypothetical protein